MPEKSLNEIPRAWREQYEKGVLNFQRQNFDYAITIFTKVLEQEPAFYDCRQALRATQFKKAGAGSSFFKRVLGGGGFSLLTKGQMALRKNPIEAINIAEEVLNKDPSHGGAHKLLAEAALAADLPRTAILSLEIVTKNSSKDKDLNRMLAAAYAHAGQVAKAEAIYDELIRAHPNDPALVQEFKDISARKTLSEGGYDALADGSGSYRDILKDKDQSVALEQEGRQVKTDDVAARLIQEQEARLEGDPRNLRLMRSIADLYLQKKEFDQALEYFHRMAATSEGAADPNLEKSISDTVGKKLDHALSQLDPTAPDYAEQHARLISERDVYLLREAKRRVDRYPNDLQMRFDLGRHYFNAGNFSEAIQEFQKAQANPHCKVQALYFLGQCFARRGMNDLAARTFQNALKDKPVFDDEKKEIVYSLGCVLEAMGKKEEAIEQFKQIYELDIGYKEVEAKIDAYYAAQ